MGKSPCLILLFWVVPASARVQIASSGMSMQQAIDMAPRNNQQLRAQRSNANQARTNEISAATGSILSKPERECAEGMKILLYTL